MHASIQLYCYYTVSIAKRNFAKSSKQNYDLSSTPKTVRMGCPHFTVYPAPREGMSKLSYLVHSPTSLFFFYVIGQFLRLGFLQWKARLNGWKSVAKGKHWWEPGIGCEIPTAGFLALMPALCPFLLSVETLLLPCIQEVKGGCCFLWVWWTPFLLPQGLFNLDISHT